MNYGSGGMGQVNFYGNQNAQFIKMSFSIPDSPMLFMPNQMPFLPNLNPNKAQMPKMPVLPETNLKTQQNENVKKEPEREKRSPEAQGNIFINFGNGGAGSSNQNHGSIGGFEYYGGGMGSSAFNDYMSGGFDYYG